jgi:hypothetical protein
VELAEENVVELEAAIDLDLSPVEDVFAGVAGEVGQRLRVIGIGLVGQHAVAADREHFLCDDLGEDEEATGRPSIALGELEELRTNLEDARRAAEDAANR